MSIEGGARAGYVNPDEKTFEYLRGGKFSPQGETFDRALSIWKSYASDTDASFDDTWELDAGALEPMVAWGINPGQTVGISEKLPKLSSLPSEEREVATRAYEYTGLSEGKEIRGTKIDVAFIGSCTNGRIADFRAAAAVVKGRHTAPGVKALAVPGSKKVKTQAEEEGLDEIFKEAGFEWREPGCSMCLAMNPDKLVGRQVSASTSNRNFIGRQGSPTGRTMLMSPAMAAAAAVTGEVTDVRDLL
jgi:3-isopropylmalate/(R)-2-methylmalate dehydratase large subunit